MYIIAVYNHYHRVPQGLFFFFLLLTQNVFILQYSNALHHLTVPESRFDHDSEESGEDMDDEEEEEEEEDEDDEAADGEATPHSQTHSHSPAAEENYIPDSPPISPVELKKELPKYLPALQVTQRFIKLIQMFTQHKKAVMLRMCAFLSFFRVAAVLKNSSV